MCILHVHWIFANASNYDVCPTGLHVKIKGQQQSLHYCTYVFTENPQPIDWIDITDHEVTYQHIRCHQISTQNEDLPCLISTLESDGLAVALILINTESSYQIQPRLVSQAWSVNIPILLVKSETGHFLQQLLNQYGRNVEAKVELTSPKEADDVPSNDQG